MATEYRVMREHVSFTNEHGEALAGLLERPEREPRAYALFAHCFTCSKTAGAASRISRALAARGFAVLRFDFTGLGNSEGDFANTNFSSNVGDLVRAAEHLRARYAPARLLIGHSLGGAAVLAAASELPEVEAIATIGAPSDHVHLQRLLSARIEDIEAQGEAEISLGGRRFTIKKQFLDDLRKQALPERVARLRKALLIMHAPLDDVVGIDEAAKIFVSAKHPKSFVSLDRADHLLNDPRDAQFAADVIGAWATRYIIAPAAEPLSPRPPLRTDEVWVEESGEGLLTDIFAGPHRLLADEPVSAGGSDRGPDPYKLVLAGLGACTSMTLRMYARLKNLPLEKVSVKLRHRKIYAQDCADCETKSGKLDEIEREIYLAGALDDAQRQRLFEIAEKCPVHRTLQSEIRVVSRLTE